MYIESVPNRGSKPAILLRESFREDGKVRKRTLANLSDLPAFALADLRRSLKRGVDGGASGVGTESSTGEWDIQSSLPHGAAAAILGTLRACGLERMLDRKDCRERRIVVAMIADRLLNGDSKLATARHCNDETATHTLGWQLDLGDLTDEDCYQAMDWLLERQDAIQRRLAAKHLTEGGLVLFDLSSSYFEGHCCPLAKRGYSRDHRADLTQITYGVVCNEVGCPVATRVFDGNTSDHKAFPEAVSMIRDDFGMQEVVFVGDRGMISGKAIDEYLRDTAGAHWITALNSVAIRQLLEQGAVQTSLLDEHDLVEIAHPDHPDERLVVCRNPLLAEERRRKREDLLVATERRLLALQERVRRPKRPLRGSEEIALAVGKVISTYKVAKHFILTISETDFSWTRDEEKIRREAALDGLYVLRTDLTRERLAAAEVVISYKQLARVEQAFKAMKSMDLRVRPVRHHLEERVRAHVFLCLLAYHVEYHMRRQLAPLLFHDEAIPERENPVQPAQRSAGAKLKDATKRAADDKALFSFEDLLRNLATVTRNKIVMRNSGGKHAFYKMTVPSVLQHKAFTLLGVTP